MMTNDQRPTANGRRYEVRELVGVHITILIFLLLSCNANELFHSLNGNTMGTTYVITYQSSQDYSAKIKLLLEEINNYVSTYIPDSDISRFNNADSVFILRKTGKDHFLINFEKSKKISRNTDGYFDPTLMPLVNYWGFGYQNKEARIEVDSTAVDSLMQMIGFDKIIYNRGKLRKSNKAVQLDFSAIAKGYAVDEISRLFEKNGVENYLVEIGGEIFAQGLNKKGSEWRLGLNTPKAEAALTDYEIIIKLSGKGMASSGNYRNFYEVDGKKYGHTINPKTGYPSLNELLAATVIATDCMTADAYATAFMAMGLEKAIAIANKNDELVACFFTSNADGIIKREYSDGFIHYVARER